MIISDKGGRVPHFRYSFVRAACVNRRGVMLQGLIVRFETLFLPPHRGFLFFAQPHSVFAFLRLAKKNAVALKTRGAHTS